MNYTLIPGDYVAAKPPNVSATRIGVSRYLVDFIVTLNIFSNKLRNLLVNVLRLRRVIGASNLVRNPLVKLSNC